MSDYKKMDIPNKTELYDTLFEKLTLKEKKLENKVFENCRFLKCNFNDAKLIHCKFTDCEFKECDLSNVKLNNTAFNETTFDSSKAVGINWTQARWPYVKLNSPIQFYQCNISHSSFYELDLTGIVIEACKAHEVDFRGSNFSDALLLETDFQRSLFMHTNLHAADFTDAINYNINPTENNIRKAKFSMPDAINLLNAFEIELQEYP